MNLKEKLIQYIDASYPIIYINSYEEEKIDEILGEVVKDSITKRKINEWNAVTGFTDFTTKIAHEIQADTLSDTLKYLIDMNDLEETILVLKDVHNYLEQPEVVAALKYIAIEINKGVLSDTTIIIEAPVRVIPKELEPYITIFEMDILSTADIKKVIDRVIEKNYLLDVGGKLKEELAISFKGLSEFEIVNILSLAYQDDGELTKKDLNLIFEQKRQMILKSGILDMIPLKETVDDIGGLDNLKKWLSKKAKVLKNIDKAKAFGVDVPKGVLIAGVPGCGKSLNAKAAAALFQVPLLKLDMGRIMGKYVGESEANMRKAIKQAETIAPCVLWIDELEKGIAGVGGDGGSADITTRLFGTLLTWMQEKESAVFVVATANDITKLPPELLRKGRFDEIFYVGLPNETERKKIFEIHVSKRRKDDLKLLDVPKLVNKTKGYSGADIEGVVKESIENIYTEGKEHLDTEDILEAIKETHSLSEIMKESLKKMSEEYENRKFKNASVNKEG